MAQIINTNSLSLMAQNNLNKSQSSLGTAIQRLSSGLRINSAKDDAAGMAISNRFTASVRGLTQAARNANDGISLAQTTEGALEEVNENLQRIRELTVQAKNGTNSEDDRKSIQKEITARLEEISRISEDTNFNGVNVLDGSTEKLTIQIGDKDGQTIDITLPKMDLAALGLDTFGTDFGKLINAPKDSVFTEAGDVRVVGNTFKVGHGTLSDFELEAADITAIATAAGIDEGDLDIVTQDDGKGNLRFFAIDNANPGRSKELDMEFADDATDTTLVNATIKESISDLDADILLNGPSEVKDLERMNIGSKITLTGAPGGEEVLDQAKLDKISNDLFGTDAAASGMQIYSADNGGTKTYYAVNKDGDVQSFTWNGTAATGTDAPARDAHEVNKVSNNLLEQLDGAMTKVTNFRADLGAVQNRFTSIIANLNTSIINTTEARSRIQDADFSVEVSAMSRANILQQAGVSVLAQANQVPQNVLSLLR
ncbi:MULTISPECIES: FliC/FljB family flagellin [Enterobacter]|jgi:flagellin|uniref:FliC/FljB family flagellin n=1 Tax=Enterobacter TaxID=547 RepID=UPI0015E58240|nr:MULTISPECIES: FliC/FljB family flagellin [Enterobacter]QLO89681.1 FliC/FljB family flagellin [Enterobacter sp. RHBSTW-00975]HDR2461411.1 FliC/FljB family flagellin [Enterobacter ludwigii]